MLIDNCGVVNNWYANSTEFDKKYFKKWLLSLLKTDTVTITFTKKNGEEREMKCTLDESIVPHYEKKTDSKPNEDTCFVYDTELKEWRSFRYDSIKVIRITLV